MNFSSSRAVADKREGSSLSVGASVKGSKMGLKVNSACQAMRCGMELYLFEVGVSCVHSHKSI